MLKHKIKHKPSSTFQLIFKLSHSIKILKRERGEERRKISSPFVNFSTPTQIQTNTNNFLRIEFFLVLQIIAKKKKKKRRRRMGKNGKNANQKKRKQTLKSLIIRENKYINIEEKLENNK